MCVAGSVGASGYSVGMGWELCVMISWKVQGGGGEIFRVWFHYGIVIYFLG